MANLRISDSQINARFLSNVQRTYSDMSKSHEQVLTGNRVNRVSEDPLAYAQGRLRQVDLDAIASAKRSADTATAWLKTADTGVASLTDILQRANELTIRGANSVYPAEQRSSIAVEIESLIAQAKSLMNGKSGDAYVFSGTATDTAPYNGTDVYLGNTGAVLRDLGSGSSVELTVTFSAVGGNLKLNAQSLIGEGNTAADGRVLDTLQTIATHLRGNDVAAPSSGDLGALKANIDALANARAAIGSAQSRVDIAVAQLTELEQTTTAALGDWTATDYTQAITQFNSQQTAYMAALQSGARLVQTSLLDFIR